MFPPKAGQGIDRLEFDLAGEYLHFISGLNPGTSNVSITSTVTVIVLEVDGAMVSTPGIVEMLDFLPGNGVYPWDTLTAAPVEGMFDGFAEVEVEAYLDANSITGDATKLEVTWVIALESQTFPGTAFSIVVNDIAPIDFSVEAFELTGSADPAPVLLAVASRKVHE